MNKRRFARGAVLSRIGTLNGEIDKVVHKMNSSRSAVKKLVSDIDSYKDELDKMVHEISELQEWLKDA